MASFVAKHIQEWSQAKGLDNGEVQQHRDGIEILEQRFEGITMFAKMESFLLFGPKFLPGDSAVFGGIDIVTEVKSFMLSCLEALWMLLVLWVVSGEIDVVLLLYSQVLWVMPGEISKRWRRT
jgi:hypothetical protein